MQCGEAWAEVERPVNYKAILIIKVGENTTYTRPVLVEGSEKWFDSGRQS